MTKLERDPGDPVLNKVLPCLIILAIVCMFLA